MGHTNSSQRMVAETILSELKDFGRSLRADEKEAFDRLMAKAVLHLGNITYTSSYNTWAILLFSILLEMEKDKID
ncbi:hypothetical protein HZB88_03040 [archaeon]|nr:hypothetical protein [archaeon]